MKITGVDVYTYDVAYAFGDYVMSHGRTQTFEPSLVVRISTDEGPVGWSETAPHGGTYLPQFFEGERAALEVLGRAVLGHDPREPRAVASVMKRHLMSGTAAKSAIDIACWDILGQASGLSVSTLLGGRLQERIRLFEAIPVGSPNVMAQYAKGRQSIGVNTFQVKVGNDPYDDAQRVAAVVEAVGQDATVIADANGGWNLQHALIAARELSGYRIFLEQPCTSMTNCAEVSQRCDIPLILDECIVSVDDLVTAKTRVGAGGISIKPARVGGITPARLLRDVAVELDMMVSIDETWGCSLATAALSHLAASTSPDHFLAVPYFTEWTTPRIASGPRQEADGYGSVPQGPGLGIDVDPALLGSPILRIN